MIRVFIAGILITGAAAASASATKDDFERCKRMERSAKSVMESRQTGVPMSDMWAIAESSDSEYVKSMYKMLVKSAYEVSRFSLEKNQNEAVLDFQNSYFSACMASAEKKK